jgi:protein TonB
MRGILALAVFAVVFVFGAAFFARDPSSLLKEDKLKSIKPTVFKVKAAEKVEVKPVQSEPEAAILASTAKLAPESFASQLAELAGGVAYGSGGNGSGIAGGGGFGGEAVELVNSQTIADRPPKVVMKTAPEYPAEARQKGVSGHVILRLLVGTSGMVESVKVDASEPSGFFDQAAMNAVRSWRFEPGLNKGQTVAAWTIQKIKFELN